VTQFSKSKGFLGTKTCSLKAVASYANIIINMKIKKRERDRNNAVGNDEAISTSITAYTLKWHLFPFALI
jgi:hypothetical protein